MKGDRPVTSHTFWKPGSEESGSLLHEERSDETPPLLHNPNSSLSIEQQRQRLPIFKHRVNLLYLAEVYQSVIVVGETGCGKSTQIPQYLLEAGWSNNGHVICVTQPRRVAAVTVAGRVSEERGKLLGDEVGYTIRFEDCSDPVSTKIKFVTDGLLIREIMADPLLKRYSVIMLDEAHERSLNTDILIGLLNKIQKKRSELRVIVASATLDAQQMFDFFNANNTKDQTKDTAAILTVEGREFPVDIHYSVDPVPDYVKATVFTVIKIHTTQNTGDVLAFMTGQDDVETVVSLLIEEAKELNKSGRHKKLMVLPMYGSLPASAQMKVFERTPKSTRKIVVATNIAEASITIDGIVYVVDCGFVKIPAYNASAGIDSLVVIPESQASANQRTGRAGRVRAGKAYRLYTEESYNQLPLATVPEIQRSSLAGVILQLKALGIDNILRFHFLSAPPAQTMVRGLELLYALQAIDRHGHLTRDVGARMCELPLPPMFAKLLLSSPDFHCSQEAVVIAAMMQIQNVFMRPPNNAKAADRCHRKFAVKEGDHVTMLNVYKAYIQYGRSSKWCHNNFVNHRGLKRASEICDQLTRLMARLSLPAVSCQDDITSLRRCLTTAFFSNAAQFHYTGEYRTVRDNHLLSVHPTSVLYGEQPPKWLVFNEVVQTNKEYMRDVTVIESEWLCELAPHFYQFGTDRELSEKRLKLDVPS